jgi:tetratricopeptide (TPR) repeat protein
MTLLSAVRAAIGVAMLAVLPPLVSAAKTPKSPTIGDLATRTIDIKPDAKVEGSARRAMENYRRYLELKNADPASRAEALRRLGDLNLEEGEFERMEKEVTALDLAGAEAIKLYTTLLKAYPDYSRNDQVLYQLARAYETTGQPEQALATLDQIVARFGSMPQISEVDFRRGEILFSAKRYPEAQQAYQRALRAGDQGPFYDESLYKLGWSLFKQSLNDESLPPFGAVLDWNLLDRKDKQRVRAFDELSRADRELVEDTLRAMSITFSYLDGADSLGAYLSKQGARPYEHLLYRKLGDLYVEKQRYQDAANTYRAFVARDPNNDNAPVLAMRAIEAYRTGGFGQLVLDGKREYIERYNFSSAFWQGRDRTKLPQVVAELKTNMKDVATYFHATAQKSKKIEDYQVAARWYRDYLASFPDDPESAATNYLLAETLFESRQYADATAEYERTAYGYPKSERSAAAGYAALASYQKERERLTGEAAAAWHKRQIDGNIKFAQSFPEHPDSGGVITRAAQDVFALNDLPRAIEVSKLVLARQPAVDGPKQRIAWTIIAQSSFDLGQFSDAEAAYVQARDLTPPADPLRKDLTERLAASVYKQAEAKRSAGDGAGAVDDFLRVAAVAPDSSISGTAQYDAAAQLVQLKLWDRAIGVLEGYRRDYPKDPKQAEVTRNLAVAYSETGRAGQAAVEFERIAGTATEEPAVQREALLTAADLYEKSGNAAKTVGMLEQFVARYPSPAAPAFEARQRLADLAGKDGNVQRQFFWYRDIVRAYATAGTERTDRARLIAARAQFALAEPTRDAFRGVQLVAPLKTSLAAKRKALETALKAYRDAVDYRVAEVTNASTYEMAELYRTLAGDVMKSERPKRLSAEEREQYDTLLEEQAFPFEEQAIQFHEVNSARVLDGQYDDWIRKSFAALAKLKPGRYGKTEVMADVATELDVPLAPPPVATALPVAGAEAGTAPAPPAVPRNFPSRARAEFDRAVNLLRAGNASEAELEFGQLALAYPDYAGPHVNLGLIKRKDGRLEAAEQSLRTATERNPAHALAWTELGVTLRMRGEFAAAQGAYEKAIAADPAYAPARRNFAVLLDLYLNNPPAALAEMEKYKELTGEDKQVSGWIAELKQRAARAAPAAEVTKPTGSS